MRPARFAIILYILFLLTQPCQDVLAAHGPGYDDASVAAEVSPPSDCNDEEAGDDCSPFCICSCRTVPAREYSVSLVSGSEPFTTVTRKAPANYTNPQTKSFAATIWQPPKH